jgi:hypothetical protein
VSYRAFTDRWGVEHVETVLGHGSISAAVPYLSRVFEHIIGLIEITKEDLTTCKAKSDTLSEDLCSYVREQVLKKHSSIFTELDLCPCASGRKIFECCGRGMLFPRQAKEAIFGMPDW